MAQSPASIISGVAYRVQTANGRTPTADSAFAGALTLQLSYRLPNSTITDRHELTGVGLASGDGIFFNEKDSHGKDVRRWRITRQHDGQGYLATQGLF